MKLKPNTKYVLLALSVILLTSSACGQMTVPIPVDAPVTVSAPTASVTANQPPLLLPDLAVSYVHLAMQGISADTANCVTAYTPYEIRAMIENRGQAPATNISIVELSSGYAIQIGELPAGQSMEIFLPASASGGAYNVSVDPQNLIAESDEGNNTATYLAITPTPPVLCSAAETPAPSVISTNIPPQVEGTTISLAALRYGVYSSPTWGQFQLADGVYYRTPPTTQESPDVYSTRIQEPIFYGDINGDGLEDALVILNTQNGGNGHFFEMAAMLNQSGNPYNVSTLSLDGVVESGSVANGIITLNLRVLGPNDPLCCPSQLITLQVVLNGGLLTKLP